jgi:hypothetical protein
MGIFNFVSSSNQKLEQKKDFLEVVIFFLKTVFWLYLFIGARYKSAHDFTSASCSGRVCLAKHQVWCTLKMLPQDEKGIGAILI